MQSATNVSMNVTFYLYPLVCSLYSLPVTASIRGDGKLLSTNSSSSTSTNGSATHSSTSTTSSLNGNSGPSRGQIHVKLISARGLNVRSVKARPYVVVQFEQNEFVSRDPTEETDKEIKGVATNLSRNS